MRLTGFKSSAYTEGALFTADKPLAASEKGVEMSRSDPFPSHQEFVTQTFAAGALDAKTKRLIALGASLAAGCEPCIRRSLAVARELGATPQELRETLAIAMVVGASKVKLLGRDCLADPSSEPGPPEPPAATPSAPTGGA